MAVLTVKLLFHYALATVLRSSDLTPVCSNHTAGNFGAPGRVSRVHNLFGGPAPPPPRSPAADCTPGTLETLKTITPIQSLISATQRRNMRAVRMVGTAIYVVHPRAPAGLERFRLE